MTDEEREAWNTVAEFFNRTPRIAKILRAPEEIIQTRFRPVDHIYYRVFRSNLNTREATVEDINTALPDELERGTYFQQQEPFLLRLRDQLSEGLSNWGDRSFW